MAPGCSLWFLAAELGVLIASILGIVSSVRVSLRSLRRDRTPEYRRALPSWMDEP
jgi:hypothetical protein